MPASSQLHVDKLLSNVSVKYRNAEFIAMSVFPEVQVKKDSDLYRIYERNFRLPETLRANKAKANEHYFNVSTATYNLEKHALKEYISDDDKENYDIFDLRADTTEELSDVILRRMEKSVADLFTTTNFSLNVSLAAGAAWVLDTTASAPIRDAATGATEVIQNSGIRPNFMIIPRNSFVGVKNHQTVVDRIKYTSAEITKTMVAGLMDVEEILEPIASYDTSELGQASSITAIWGDSSFIGFRPRRPSPKVPSTGYIFRRSTPMVKRWRDEEREADAIEVQMKYQARIVASLSGFLIKDTE
jgi:hypothetical protein